MEAPFAACESLLNTAVQAHLANAIACFTGGEPVAVVFDTPPAEASLGLAGMASYRPMVGLPTEKVPADAVGHGITVAGQPYRVAEVHHDRGTGWSLLHLERAA